MATIKNGILEEASGSLGNTYLRVQNGKVVVCNKPSKYRASMKERPKAIRGMMSILRQLSSKLTKDPFFYDLWKVKEIKGLGPYHKFVTRNHFGESNTLDLANLILSPREESFPAAIDQFSIADKKISVTLKPLGNDSGINTFREPLIAVHGCVAASGYKRQKKEELKVKVLQTKPEAVDLNTPMQLNFDFLVSDLAGKYTDVTILLILTTLNSEENLVRTSVTMSCHVKLS